MTARTSIVIVNFNQRPKLQRMLEAFKIDEALTFEIIVVDNASFDESIKMLREQFRTVRIVTMERNAGFFAGIRAGFKHALGDIVIVCHPDLITSVVTLMELADQLRAAAGRKAIAMLPRLTDLRGNREPNVGRLPTLMSGIIGELAPQSARKLSVPTLDHVADHEYVSLRCCTFEAGFVQAAGGIDREFFAGFGDADLCARLHDKGGRILISKDVSVIHDASKSGSSNMDRLLRRDQARYFEKHRGWEASVLRGVSATRKFLTRASE